MAKVAPARAEIDRVVARAHHPALHFSGGKDSLACLYLARERVLAGLPVYWVNTGDSMPETAELVARERRWIPEFREVRTDVHRWRELYGAPSDITTAQSNLIGQLYGMDAPPLSGRFDCYYANTLKPMHDRMLADGVDAVIRGTKQADADRMPANGPTDFYEVCLPLIDWSHAEVFAFLQAEGVEVGDTYRYFESTGEPSCLHCTAWWGGGFAAYLRARHPTLAAQRKHKLIEIRTEVAYRAAALDREIKALTGDADGQAQ